MKKIIAAILVLVLLCATVSVYADDIHLLWGIEFGQTIQQVKQDLWVKKKLQMSQSGTTSLRLDTYDPPLKLCGIDNMFLQYINNDGAERFDIYFGSYDVILNLMEVTAVVNDLRSKYGEPTGSYYRFYNDQGEWSGNRKTTGYRKTVQLNADNCIVDPLSLLLEWEHLEEKSKAELVILFNNIRVYDVYNRHTGRYMLEISFCDHPVAMPQYWGDEAIFPAEYTDTGF